MADFVAPNAIMTADIEALNERADSNGIIRGMAASPGAGLTVDIAAGVGRASKIIRRFTATTNVALATADPTNPRKDFIVLNAAGSIVKIDGTPQAAKPAGEIRRNTVDPDAPDIPAGETVIAEIWVAAGATSLVAADISDRRLFTGPHRRGVWASDFATSGDGSDASPWPIQAIIDAIQFVIDEGDVDSPGKVYLDSGIFRGTQSIAFVTNSQNMSGITVQGMGMGGWTASGLGGEIGKGTLIDYTGSGVAFQIGDSLMANVHRVTLRDFTLRGTSSAAQGLLWEEVFRSSLQNIFFTGFTQDSATNWAFEAIDSFSGQFNHIQIHNCYNGINLAFSANNGFQADLGFVEVDGFNLSGTTDRVGIRLKGCLSATKFGGFMIVGMPNPGAGTSRGIQITSCKGTVVQSPYVEGSATTLQQIGIQVDNSQQVTLIGPCLTRIGGIGLNAFGNSGVPVAINPQFGADSGDNSTGTGFEGGWMVYGEPLFKTEWTGTKYPSNAFVSIMGRDFTATLIPPQFVNLDTTPSIANDGFWETNNAGATSITDFDDGIEGQTLEIFFNDTFTTIVHNASLIVLKSGANHVGAVGDILKLRHRDGIWYESNGLTA